MEICEGKQDLNAHHTSAYFYLSFHPFNFHRPNECLLKIRGFLFDYAYEASHSSLKESWEYLLCTANWRRKSFERRKNDKASNSCVYALDLRRTG